MTTSLIDSANGLISPELASRIATHLNEPAHGVTAGLTGGMSTMLLGVLRKTGDSSAMRGVFNMVTSGMNDGRVLEDPSSLIGAAPGNPMTALGGQFLSTIFGNRGHAVNTALEHSSGLQGSSVASIMYIGAPLLLGMLGKRVREGSLDAAGLTRMFSDDRDSIEAAAPPEVSDAIGAPEGPERRAEYAAPTMERGPVVDRTTAYERGPRRTNTWVWPVVAALVIIGLLWGTRSRRPSPHAMAIPAETTNTAAGEVLPPAMTTIHLPNGTTISVASNGPEAKLVSFLNDSTQRVDSTWLVLNGLHFDNQTAALRPESQAQLRNVEAILIAYPRAMVKIGGYTDSTGNEAANEKLSKERASAARMAIIKLGAPGSRVTAQGYGSQNPVATNSTEAGRELNRRIALLVVQK